MPDVVVTQAGAVLEIQFNRPEKKNALTRAMYQAVQDAFARADEDPGIRVMLLFGVGDTFTSGNDIKDFQARAATQEPVQTGCAFAPRCPHAMPLCRVRAPLPHHADGHLVECHLAASDNPEADAP